MSSMYVKSRLAEPDAENGFLLDGYPRTVGQVEYLDALLAEQGTGIDSVIQLVADQDELVGRLLKRSEEQGRKQDGALTHARHSTTSAGGGRRMWSSFPHRAEGR